MTRDGECNIAADALLMHLPIGTLLIDRKARARCRCSIMLPLLFCSFFSSILQAACHSPCNPTMYSMAVAAIARPNAISDSTQPSLYLFWACSAECLSHRELA